MNIKILNKLKLCTVYLGLVFTISCSQERFDSFGESLKLSFDTKCLKKLDLEAYFKGELSSSDNQKQFDCMQEGFTYITQRFDGSEKTDEYTLDELEGLLKKLKVKAVSRKRLEVLLELKKEFLGGSPVVATKDEFSDLSFKLAKLQKLMKPVDPLLSYISGAKDLKADNVTPVVLETYLTDAQPLFNFLEEELTDSSITYDKIISWIEAWDVDPEKLDIEELKSLKPNFVKVINLDEEAPINISKTFLNLGFKALATGAWIRDKLSDDNQNYWKEVSLYEDFEYSVESFFSIFREFMAYRNEKPLEKHELMLLLPKLKDYGFWAKDFKTDFENEEVDNRVVDAGLKIFNHKDSTFGMKEFELAEILWKAMKAFLVTTYGEEFNFSLQSFKSVTSSERSNMLLEWAKHKAQPWLVSPYQMQVPVTLDRVEPIINYESLFRLSWLRTLSEFAVHSYSQDKSVAIYDGYLQLDELKTLYADIYPALEALGLESMETSWFRIFYEHDLFVPAGNGNLLVDFMEANHFFTYLFSAVQSVSKAYGIDEGYEKLCEGQLNYTCQKEKVLTNPQSPGFVHLPRTQLFLKNTPDLARGQGAIWWGSFYEMATGDSILKSQATEPKMLTEIKLNAQYEANREEPLPKGQVFRSHFSLQYSELVSKKFDKNEDQVLDLFEIMDAYDVFIGALGPVLESKMEPLKTEKEFRFGFRVLDRSYYFEPNSEICTGRMTEEICTPVFDNNVEKKVFKESIFKYIFFEFAQSGELPKDIFVASLWKSHLRWDEKIEKCLASNDLSLDKYCREKADIASVYAVISFLTNQLEDNPNPEDTTGKILLKQFFDDTCSDSADPSTCIQVPREPINLEGLSHLMEKTSW